MRRLIWPQRDVLNTLEIEDLTFLTNRDRVRLREAATRTARLGDELQALSERAVLVHEQLLDTRAEQMNRNMLVLAAATVVLMPLTVISGPAGHERRGHSLRREPGGVLAWCRARRAGQWHGLFMRKRKWL